MMESTSISQECQDNLKHHDDGSEDSSRFHQQRSAGNERTLLAASWLDDGRERTASQRLDQYEWLPPDESDFAQSTFDEKNFRVGVPTRSGIGPHGPSDSELMAANQKCTAVVVRLPQMHASPAPVSSFGMSMPQCSEVLDLGKCPSISNVLQNDQTISERSEASLHQVAETSWFSTMLGQLAPSSLTDLSAPTFDGLRSENSAARMDASSSVCIDKDILRCHADVIPFALRERMASPSDLVLQVPSASDTYGGLNVIPRSLPQPNNPFRDNLVHEAMSFVSDKTAYMHACMVCPEVVNRESKHDHFLEFCGGDMWQGAQRLANYWKLRLEVFGPNKAFLPLANALSPEDYAYLRLPHRVKLPSDKFGRPIHFCDRTLWNTMRQKVSSAPLDIRLRSFFVFIQMCADAARRSGRGEVVLVIRVNTHGVSVQKHDKETVDLFHRCYANAMYARCAEVHYVSVADESVFSPLCGSLLLLATMTAKIAERVHAIFASSVNKIMHDGTPDAVLRSLENEGMIAENLPRCVGGALDLEREWLSHLRMYFPEAFAVDDLALGWDPGVLPRSNPRSQGMMPESLTSQPDHAATLPRDALSLGVTELNTTPNQESLRSEESTDSPLHGNSPPTKRGKNQSTSRREKKDEDIIRSVEYFMEQRKIRRRQNSRKYNRRHREKQRGKKEP